MKRLLPLLAVAVAALVVALWPSADPPPSTPSQPVETTRVSRPAPLPALAPALEETSLHTPRLVARLEPVVGSGRGKPSLTEQGFAPEATETGWPILPPEPPPGPNDSRSLRAAPSTEEPFERSPDDTALQHLAPLAPTQLEDHGAGERGTEEEQHQDGGRVTWAPGVPRTEYEMGPLVDFTRQMKALPGLPEDHPRLVETRAPAPVVPVWTGQGTDTTRAQ